MRFNRYTVTIIAFVSFLLFMILNKMGLFGVGVLLFLVLGLAVIGSIPFLYRKKLDEREPKSLRGFIMSDPELRQALKPEAKKEAQPTNHENPPSENKSNPK